MHIILKVNDIDVSTCLLCRRVCWCAPFFIIKKEVYDAFVWRSLHCSTFHVSIRKLFPCPTETELGRAVCLHRISLLSESFNYHLFSPFSRPSFANPFLNHKTKRVLHVTALRPINVTDLLKDIIPNFVAVHNVGI